MPPNAKVGRVLVKSKNESITEIKEKGFRSVSWEGVFWTILLPIIGLVAAAFTPLRAKTAVWAVIYHFTTGVGITAGPCTHMTMPHLMPNTH